MPTRELHGLFGENPRYALPPHGIKNMVETESTERIALYK